jgi:hypothetical protein
VGREDPSNAGHIGVGKLFDREPFQYGLRGDYELWLRMRLEFADLPLPPDGWDVRAAVETAYQQVVGHVLPDHPHPAESIYVPDLSIGRGMSDGHVNPHFWRFTAIPLIQDRWAGAVQL